MTAPEQRIEWWLISRGLFVRREYHLPDGGRLDMAGLSDTARPIGVEIKRTMKDWRRDTKWPRYLPFVRQLWIAFPENVLPSVIDLRLGVLAWREYDLLIVREARDLVCLH
jgi:hypothetical protein